MFAIVTTTTHMTHDAAGLIRRVRTRPVIFSDDSVQYNKECSSSTYLLYLLDVLSRRCIQSVGTTNNIQFDVCVVALDARSACDFVHSEMKDQNDRNEQRTDGKYE